MSNFVDVMSGADLTGGVNYILTIDRFYRKNEAYNLQNGYLQTPQLNIKGSYFTITYWMLTQTYGSFIGFANFANIYFQSSSNQFEGFFFNQNKWISVAGPAIQLNKWTYIAITLKGNTLSLYLNGLKVTTNSSLDTLNNAFNSRLANATFDEIKIYLGAMTDAQIATDFNTIPSNSYCC